MIIETHALTKQYGNKTACDKISLSVKTGQVYGFLGRNGAGKSTCVKMLTGLIFPTSGSGAVLGRPLGDVSAREKMGYLPELFRYQDWMSGADLLNFHARMLQMRSAPERIRQVLKLVGLEGQEKYKVGAYSKGMQQRIGLACALLSSPRLLFLDEPTSALDPIGRKAIRDIIVALRTEGITVFLNSHLLSEVEAVCDHVAFIDKGTVVRSAPMDELLMASIRLTIRAQGVTEEMLARLAGLYDSWHRLADGGLSVTLRDYEQIPALASALIAQGATLYELTPHRETLETVFMRLVGEEG